MGRFRNMSGDDGGDGSIDMSPLIDCVFILLIFFIVTTTFVEETGVEVDKPQAASAVRLEKESLLLGVTKDGGVFHNERNVGIAGVQALVRRALLEEDVPVIVQADAGAEAGIMVRVIDEAKLGGAQKVSIASQRSRQ